MRRREFPMLTGAAVALWAVGCSSDRGVSPFDYGAVADGVTDDALALQEAIDEAVAQGADLYLPPGTYYLSQPLQLDSDHSGLRIFGDEGATVVLRTTGNMPALEVGFCDEPATDISLANLTLRGAVHGSGAAVSNRGLAVENAVLTLENLTFETASGEFAGAIVGVSQIEA